MGKFLSISVTIILAMILIAGIIWLKKVNDGKVEGQDAQSLRVCEFVSFNTPCEEDVKTIPQDNGDIWATVELKNITNTQLISKWYYVQGGTRSVIGEGEQTVYSDQVVQLKLEKDLTKGWFIGDYVVEVSLDGGTPMTKEFEIVGND